MILLYCTHVSGQVSVPHPMIEGMRIEPRTYDIKDHFVEVDGAGNDYVVSHDANRICEMAPEMYRLATPEEQTRYAKMKRRGNQLVE